ncbi:MAG: phospho-2-dehydro-3-deoxyheptonate aldolase [Rhodothermaceae bacterium]|nr:MAG: phospho-2-dehydro-3-deoxyheptonate aldolase [Rhodothermaceae bacterium]
MVVPSVRDWHPASWRDREALQQPDYEDTEALETVRAHLAALPPLVTSWEVERLKQQLAEAAAGRRFLLQGGDCAERFDECSAAVITNRLKVLLQMSLVLVYGLRLPIVRVGRLAGQYAKPRSADVETRNGRSLPSYRGDIINGPGFSADERRPDPRRMLEAYSRSALTLNFIRALAEGGFADLHHPEYWDLDFVQHSPLAADYRHIVDAIAEAIRFMETVSDAPLHALERVTFYTSHEALLLPYEEALTRFVAHRPGAYNLSTHFPWIGMRTAQPDGAHVEYARGIANPIGLKVGPDMTPSWLCDLLDRLNPDDEPGRLTLITRFGANRIGDCLPPLIEAVRATGRMVLWCCDPMHGNTETTESGLKTRRFENILAELEQAFDIHAAMGTHLGGVHFELTGEDVTECIGGARGLDEADLERAYKSHVDPRLNGEQALEMAFRIVRKHQRMRA